MKSTQLNCTEEKNLVWHCRLSAMPRLQSDADKPTKRAFQVLVELHIRLLIASKQLMLIYNIDSYEFDSCTLCTTMWIFYRSVDCRIRLRKERERKDELFISSIVFNKQILSENGRKALEKHSKPYFQKPFSKCNQNCFHSNHLTGEQVATIKWIVGK